jgi:phage terminase large subunit
MSTPKSPTPPAPPQPPPSHPFATLEVYITRCAQALIPQSILTLFLTIGYIALPWALRFHRYALEADHPDGPTEILCGGARGPGKTFATFNQGVVDCLRFDGLKVLFLRQVGKQAKESIDDLRRKTLLRHNVAHTWLKQERMIEFPNGSRIIVGNFKDEGDIDKYLGLEYDVIIIEELTQLSKEKVQALRESNRSSNGWRPRLYCTTNPGGRGHAHVMQRFINPHRTDTEVTTRFIPATVDDNPLIDEGYKDKLEENSGWRLRAYRYGGWDIAAGQFFINFRADIHVLPADSLYLPVTWRWWGALDYGFNHSFVFLLGALNDMGEVFVVDEYACRGQLVPEMVDGIGSMLQRYGLCELTDSTVTNPYRMIKRGSLRLRKVAAGADIFAKRGGETERSIANMFGERGLSLVPAIMDRVNGWGQILQRLGKIDEEGKEVIAPTLFFSQRCKRLIERLPSMVHDPDRLGDMLKVDADESGEGGDDEVDALRYLVMSLPVARIEPQRLRYANALPDSERLGYPFD